MAAWRFGGVRDPLPFRHRHSAARWWWVSLPAEFLVSGEAV